MRLIAVCLLSLVCMTISPAPSFGQTRLHRDYRGVSRRVGNVDLHIRTNGVITTSVGTGRFVLHSSNRGHTGWTYHSDVGQFDSFTWPNGSHTTAWYTPKFQLQSLRTNRFSVYGRSRPPFLPYDR